MPCDDLKLVAVGYVNDIDHCRIDCLANFQ
jgi:hypothetical protein